MSIKSSRLKKYTTVSKSGGHSIVNDVPEQMGGLNLGMTPHELIEAALAACTSITIQMVADRNKWPLESADVEVKITDEKGDKIQYSREITLIGNLDESQKQKLLEMADKCPVHGLLEKPGHVATILKDI